MIKSYYTNLLFIILLISSAKLLFHPIDIQQVPNLRGSSDADRVYSIPNAPQLTTATYSGYLAVGDSGKALHYYFTESQNDPYNDPVIIWTNGGPGCSSMLGLLQQHGPFYMEDFGDRFYNNPFSWNIEANVLYVEQPAGVGYSTVANQQQLKTNDEQSSSDFLDAVVSFYEKFTPYKTNDLWVTGESYGGIYVPWLAKRILDHNALPESTEKINLKGIVVANGVSNYTYDINMALLNMSYYHSMYSPELRKVFDDNKCKLYRGFIPNPQGQSPECKEFQNKFQDLIKRINFYDIYRKCYVPPAEEFLKEHTVYIDGYEKTYSAGMTALDYTPWKFFGSEIHKAQQLKQKLKENSQIYGDAPPCIYDKGVSDFLNNQDVRTALHIPTTAPAWTMCAESNFRYTIASNGSYWLYPELIAAGLDILLFSGDTDGAAPTIGNQMWIKEMGWDIIQDWTPWKVDGTVAGYKIVYDGMTFATIHGVGHMAAQWARKQVVTMLNSFTKTGSF